MSEKRRPSPYRYTRPQPAECPADVSSDPCICGWHDLLAATEAALHTFRDDPMKHSFVEKLLEAAIAKAKPGQKGEKGGH